MLSKKIVSLGACVLLLFSNSAPAFAANVVSPSVSSPPITVFFVYTNRASSTLSISNGKASIRGYVQKSPSGKNIELTSTLEGQPLYFIIWKDMRNINEMANILLCAFIMCATLLIYNVLIRGKSLSDMDWGILFVMLIVSIGTNICIAAISKKKNK